MAEEDRLNPLGSAIVTILMLVGIIGLAALGSNGHTGGKHRHPSPPNVSTKAP